jgi:hypothetical protein
LATASGHIIFTQLSIGPRKRAYYLSPTINWLHEVGVLFLPNDQLAPAKGHIIFHQLSIASSKQTYYFSTTFNWLQQLGILFFKNIKLPPGSGRIIFQQHLIGSDKRAYYLSESPIGPASRHVIFPQSRNFSNNSPASFVAT